MLLVDFYFMWIALILAVLFTVAAFIWKGMWWIGILAGFIWILWGLWGINSSGNPVITFQRELSIVFIVIGIGVFFLPFYLHRKQNKSITEKFDELDEYNKDVEDYQRELDRLRKTRRNRG